MVDVGTENVLTLAQAAKLYPRRTHVSTVHRHVTAGIRSKHGVPIILESIKAGGRWATSEEAVGRFFAALTADRTEKPGTPKAVTPGHRRAVALLNKAGF